MSDLGLIGSSPEALRAWQKFRAGTNYRIARPGDFSLATDRYRAYGDGDFNGDGIYGDFAVIVVDDTVTDASRFGLVIFNARGDSRRYPRPILAVSGRKLINDKFESNQPWSFNCCKDSGQV
jgi:hypothetical protein